MRARSMVEERSAVSKDETLLPDGWVPFPLDCNYNYKSPGYRLYKYRGTTTNNIHLDWGLMEQLKQFRGRSSDIIVASFLKSGTTWLQEIVWRVTHHTEAECGGGSGVPLEFRFPLLDVQPQKGLMEMLPLEKMADPRFIKTHLHYHILPESVITSGCKVLYVSRDARDVCVSNYHFSRMINIHQYRGSFADYRDSFMRGAMVYGPYREHVKGYLQHSDTVLCVTYEQMHQDRASVVQKVADFLGVCLTDSDVSNIVRATSFEFMKENPDTNFRHWEKTGMIPGGDEGTFMRKGVVGDWKNYFTEKENEEFMEWLDKDVTSL